MSVRLRVYLKMRRWLMRSLFHGLLLRRNLREGFLGILAGEVFGETVALADTNRTDRVPTVIANEYLNVHAQGLAREKGTQLAEREYVKQFSGMRYATAEMWAYHADDIREIVEREKSGGAEILQDTATGEFHISLPQPAHLAIAIDDLALADRDTTIPSLSWWCETPPVSSVH